MNSPWFQYALTFLSMAVGVLGVASIACFAFGYACESLGKLRVQQDNNVKQLAAREIGTRIVQTYYWFSEDDRAMEAVKAVGEQLTHGGYWFNVEAARERWRKVVYGATADRTGGE